MCKYNLGTFGLQLNKKQNWISVAKTNQVTYGTLKMEYIYWKINFVDYNPLHQMHTLLLVMHRQEAVTLSKTNDVPMCFLYTHCTWWAWII